MRVFPSENSPVILIFLNLVDLILENSFSGAEVAANKQTQFYNLCFI